MDTRHLTIPPAIDSTLDNQTLFASQRDEMKEIIGRHCQADGSWPTSMAGLTLFRGSQTSAPSCTIVASAFAMMTQGAKRISVSEEVYDYDSRHYLISSVDLPMLARVTEASAEQPYLGLALGIDPLKIREMTAHLPPLRRGESIDRGIAVGTLDTDIQNTALRLVRLLDRPEDIPALAPIIERELLYRLLSGRLGARLRQAAATGSHSHQIIRIIGWLRQHIDQAISIEQLADLANMSKSSLHHHFKALTAMTPVQYQKQLRLHEARRLMLMDNQDAASAAHRVGYESPSQFSREYRRMFGAPPARDIASLRQN